MGVGALGTMKEDELGSPEGLLEWSNAATFWALGAQSGRTLAGQS